MITRREILSAFGAAALSAALPKTARAAETMNQVLPKRLLGRTGRMITPLALGGQASLQWTPPGVEAPDIIVRAVQLGVNYLDTANAYGPSQMSYGEAFRGMDLVPGRSSYNAKLREHLYLASKTTRRFARDPEHPDAPTAIDELKRSLTQIFGDGKGYIPEGAYLDCMQMHAIRNPQDVDQVYIGLHERGGKMPDQIGTFAALLDYRDGTNYTGLNPDGRRWIRHIGVTGHNSSPLLMKLLRQDENNDLDTLLVALNVNDKLYLPHQNNVLPLAMARGMGVIAMKVFADGVFYGKKARFSYKDTDVVTSVGKADNLDYRELVRYSVSLPGVTCAVTGIGHIDRDNPVRDQLVANLAAAVSEPMSVAGREKLEREAASRFGATTNYFQDKAQGLVQPSDVKITRDADRLVVTWNTAYAGPNPIRSWQIRAGNKTVLSIPFRPQMTTAPLSAYIPASQAPEGKLEVVASETLQLQRPE